MKPYGVGPADRDKFARERPKQKQERDEHRRALRHAKKKARREGKRRIEDELG